MKNWRNWLAIWANPTLAARVEDSHWNAFGVYSFTDDRLKGLEIGFGATYQGSRRIDQTNSTPSVTTESLLIGYSRKVDSMGHGGVARIQLNVDNLFGDDTLVFTNFNGSTGMDYNFVPPRRTTLTLSYEF